MDSRQVERFAKDIQVGDQIEWCGRVVQVVDVERAKPATRHTRGAVLIWIETDDIPRRRNHYYDDERVSCWCAS